MCLLVCIGAWTSTRLSVAVHTDSCIWLSNGIISAFVLTAPGRWKIPFFVAGQITNMSVDLALGNTLLWACWFVVCNSTEVLLTVLSLGHCDKRSRITTRRALTRIGIFGVILGPLACALLAAPAVWMIEGRPIPEAARIWFMADALGCAATLPMALFLLTRPRESGSNLRIRAADTAWAVALLGAALATFWQTRYPILFMLFPPLVATLFRFRLAGAVYGASFIVILAAAFTAEGHGPFVLSPGTKPSERVTVFQMFGLVMFASCVPLGLSIEERHLLEANLRNANRQLGDLALLDPLTGIRNRRDFDTTVKSEWSRACATGEDLSLVFLDIDFFKLFNDTYGHQRGDDCLRSVAGTLSASVRESVDVVARYGGEEFVILIPAASARSARDTANRIASGIVKLNIPHKESPFGIVTASFGIATVHPRLGGDPAALVGSADRACYKAKKGGRHRIETFPEPELISGLQIRGFAEGLSRSR